VGTSNEAERMELILAQPRGFCAGVVRAIDVVERTIALHGSPVYVLHEIVHNRRVVEDLEAQGAIFVEDLADVPPGGLLIFSAHGVARRVEDAAQSRGLRVLDATCPLVTKVHLQAQRYAAEGRELIVVGHAGHVEVVGTIGQVDGPVHVLSTVEEVAALEVQDPHRLAYVTQTTLSLDDTRAVVEALRARFPSIRGPGLDDICYATQNRQRAVRELTRRADVVLVVGARNSSNSNRLREVGAQHGVPSYLIETAADIDPAWLPVNGRVGITAGASTPEILVEQVIARLESLGARAVSTIDGVQETTTFRLPVELVRPIPVAEYEGSD
jgi:4-hydroxy-3-methylbut-2-enyl diphosphate reductase